MNLSDSNHLGVDPKAPKPTIVIADTEGMFCVELMNASVARGMGTHTVTSVNAAIRCIEQFKPDYVVVDQRLPAQGAMEVIKVAKSARRKSRSIVVTRYPSLACAVKFVREGAWDYLAKPTTARVVLDSLAGTTGMAMEDLPGTANPLSVNRLEWEHIQRMLELNGANVSATARALGMHRRTLQRKLIKYPSLR